MNLVSPIKSKTRVQIVEAIRQLNFAVVPQDVAVKTGLPLLNVTSELNAIATETGADLRVNNLGKIQYVFKPSFEDEFLKNALKNAGTAISNVAANIFIVLAKAIHLVALTFGASMEKDSRATTVATSKIKPITELRIEEGLLSPNIGKKLDSCEKQIFA